MEVKQFIEENFEQMKADLKSVVDINSEYSEDEKPFGSGARKALDQALKLMEEKGLKTTNVDYYCGFGEVGQGDKLIGILAHLDVVPAGEGWDSDPYDMIEKDGYVYGRGVTDDKGAGIASMYALKYLIDENYPFKKRVRLILGCNEEKGSACIRYYVSKYGHVDYGFTPDGDFPGIYAEKGMCGAMLTGKNSKIIWIEGGDVSNAVCKRVSAAVPADSFDEDKFKTFLDQKGVRYSLIKEGTTKIIVHGKSAHASMPDLGVNAFNYLMEALYVADFNDTFTDWFHKYFGLDLHGERLGFESIKDDISDTSINFGVVSDNDNEINVTLDMRFPVKAKAKDVVDLLSISDENNTCQILNTVEPLYFDIDSPMIKALKKAYVDVTGDSERQMMAIGGGTYAKSINNIIAFGCEFPGEESHIHDVNERMNLELFKKQVEIYVEAIKNLNEIED